MKEKVKMNKVMEQKYLGFVISSDGSNMKNIGIMKTIQYIISSVGKYTIECGIIYLNSLLRSSILFAAETMYNINEDEYRRIKGIEEDLLRKIFKTEQGCPIYLLYFKSGHVPARIAIERMKIVFYRYIQQI